ncbi:hypothetical protein [Acetobacter conturbans]|uniref:Uncharacterized protein n=1 Tax=Acetobacter conturbans TaxID=1737472 RepID=A0ABX0JWE5_9PROT|nr:hypothetical protein [Acetobacter conturbans]NHN87811.1 hypothetical protein [Acetobacter conturbans]
MHMLIICLAGLALCGILSIVTPHYTPAAETLAICLALIGVLGCWITVHEEP